jgi:hypothetical protein
MVPSEATMRSRITTQPEVLLTGHAHGAHGWGPPVSGCELGHQREAGRGSSMRPMKYSGRSRVSPWATRPASSSNVWRVPFLAVSSRKISKASWRFRQASSTVRPQEAISSSRQYAVYIRPSRQTSPVRRNVLGGRERCMAWRIGITAEIVRPGRAPCKGRSYSPQGRESFWNHGGHGMGHGEHGRILCRAFRGSFCAFRDST